MAKYISLVKYTAKGIENIKDSPNRLDAVKQLCESMRETALLSSDVAVAKTTCSCCR